MQSAFPEPILAAGLSGHESGFPNITLVQSGAAETFSKMASGVSLTFFSCHVPPGALLKLDSVAAFTQTTLPPLVFPGVCQWRAEGSSFGAGTLQSLRVWWKKEAVLTELPYDSKRLLDGI